MLRFRHWYKQFPKSWSFVFKNFSGYRTTHSIKKLTIIIYICYFLFPETFTLVSFKIINKTLFIDAHVITESLIFFSKKREKNNWGTQNNKICLGSPRGDRKRVRARYTEWESEKEKRCWALSHEEDSNWRLRITVVGDVGRKSGWEGGPGVGGLGLAEGVWRWIVVMMKQRGTDDCWYLNFGKGKWGVKTCLLLLGMPRW